MWIRNRRRPNYTNTNSYSYSYTLTDRHTGTCSYTNFYSKTNTSCYRSIAAD